MEFVECSTDGKRLFLNGYSITMTGWQKKRTVFVGRCSGMQNCRANARLQQVFSQQHFQWQSRYPDIQGTFWPGAFDRGWKKTGADDERFSKQVNKFGI